MTMSLKVSCGGLLREYGIDGLFLQASESLYGQSQRLVCIASSKSDPFPLRVGLFQGFPLSPILFITFMYRISRRSQVAEVVSFGGLPIPLLLFADDVVLLASKNNDPQLSLGRFAPQCQAARENQDL